MRDNKHNQNTIYGVIYARYSPGPNQTDQSIEGQVRDCEEYAKQNNIKIIEIYADRHLTGTESEHRDEFQRMLRDAEKKQFSVVLTWKIDRFGRNREEIAINKVHLKKHGVKVCYAKEHIPEGPEGIILESMLEGLAEYYSAELAQKIRRGQRESVLKGRILTVKALYGYIKDNDKHYIINESEAGIVREIFQSYADGSTLKKICDQLEERGIRNPNGKRFTYNMLHNMLRNRQYIGEYRFGDNFNPNAIPPIISTELFENVQEILKEKEIPKVHAKTAAQARASVTYFLSDKTTCSICGRHYQGESGTGKKGTSDHYYKCHGKKSRKEKCNSRTFRKEWLEDFILYHTFEDVLTDRMIDIIADKVIEIQNTDNSNYSVKALSRQLADCNKKIKNIMNAIEAGIFTETTKNRLSELETEKEQLTLSLTKEQNKRTLFSKDHIIYWLELFRDGNVEDIAFREKFFSIFINHVVIYDDKLAVAMNIINKNKTIPFEHIENSVRMLVTSVE